MSSSPPEPPGTTGSAAIRASGLVRSFGARRALDGFTLDVERGRVFGLLGPNGSGKTTFLGIVSGLDRAEAGSISVLGDAPGRTVRARLGVMFQENAQDPLMRAGELLALAGTLFGLTTNEAKRRAAALLEMTGLADRARDPIANLSGGMRRRLDLARALLHRPELVLLDEPTTGIDPGERRALWDALRQSRDAGVTVVLATNDLAEADAVCDAVAFAREGRVLATGNPTELKRGLAAESLHLTWASPAESQLAAVANLPGVSTVTADRDTVRVTARDASALIPALFATAPGQVRAVSLQPTSLEDAYFRIVGQRSREGGAP